MSEPGFGKNTSMTRSTCAVWRSRVRPRRSDQKANRMTLPGKAKAVPQGGGQAKQQACLNAPETAQEIHSRTNICPQELRGITGLGPTTGML